MNTAFLYFLSSILRQIFTATEKLRLSSSVLVRRKSAEKLQSWFVGSIRPSPLKLYDYIRVSSKSFDIFCYILLLKDFLRNLYRLFSGRLRRLRRQSDSQSIEFEVPEDRVYELACHVYERLPCKDQAIAIGMVIRRFSSTSLDYLQTGYSKCFQLL